MRTTCKLYARRPQQQHTRDGRPFYSVSFGCSSHDYGDEARGATIDDTQKIARRAMDTHRAMRRGKYETQM